MDLAELIASDRLSGLRPANGSYLARCPAHEDHHPSLSIREGEDGRILLHCWAGCTTKAVIDALGLTWADLFPKRPRTRSRR